MKTTHPHMPMQPSDMVRNAHDMPMMRRPSFKIHPLETVYSSKAMATGTIVFPLYSFLFLTEGQLLIKKEDKHIHIEAPAFFLNSPNEPFSIEFFDTCQGYMGGFSDALIDTIGNQFNSRCYRFLHLLPKNIIELDKITAEAMTALCKRLLNLSNTAGKDEHIAVYLNTLITEVDLAYHVQSSSNHAFNPLCHAFIEKVFASPNQTRPISKYADQLCVSVAHLSKVVKQISGRSPLSWITEAVMLESKQLLVHSDLNITEIAMHVGIDDASYFTRLFKKEVGVTPTAYRKDKKVQY